MELRGLDVYDPTSGEIRSSSTDDIACCGEGDVKAALMVGGGSFIPSVQRLMRRELGDRVLLERPWDAVARGAAAFAAGVDFYDHIQHDYAIRCLRADKCCYDIGFTESGGSYALIADWWGIQEVQPEAFVRDLTKRYAYCATRATLEEQGFALVDEEVAQDGRLHLTLRRTA